MRVGYPCINRSVGCRGNKTFRLSSYSEEKLIETASNNLECLETMLRFNINNDLLFFRISSDIVPFASHPVCELDWTQHFESKLQSLGKTIAEYSFRISMHPDQFVLINSPRNDVLKNSISELYYHCRLMDAMGLDNTAKMQIHVGGVYGDKPAAIEKFIQRYNDLDEVIKRRLVIENDDRLYDLRDCVQIHGLTGIPVLFDVYHHELLNNGESVPDALRIAESTWSDDDGKLMVDYSSPHPSGRRGKHADEVDLSHFGGFIQQSEDIEFDLMLEIKDKEKSAIKVIESLEGDKRLESVFAKSEARESKK